MTAPSSPEHWRALDAPFTPPDEWQPIPGTCTRCGQPAWLGERRWWHDGPPCPAGYRRGAEFQPD